MRAWDFVLFEVTLRFGAPIGLWFTAQFADTPLVDRIADSRQVAAISMGTALLVAVWVGVQVAIVRAGTVNVSPWWAFAIPVPVIGEATIIVLACLRRRPTPPRDDLLFRHGMLGALGCAVPLGGVLAIVAAASSGAECQHPSHSAAFCLLALFLLGWLTAMIRCPDGVPQTLAQAADAATVATLVLGAAMLMARTPISPLRRGSALGGDDLGLVAWALEGMVAGGLVALGAIPFVFLGVACWWLLVGRRERRRRVRESLQPGVPEHAAGAPGPPPTRAPDV